MTKDVGYKSSQARGKCEWIERGYNYSRVAGVGMCMGEVIVV